MAVDPERFKRALGAWPSGVTIVTSQHGELRHGMTASAFCSVSAEPPQVLICANQTSSTHGVIEKSRAFCVNVLAQGQEALSNLFADKSREAIRFDGLDCVSGATGCPRIPGAIASLDCSVAQAVEAGTHVVYIGLVEDISLTDTAPLVFLKGNYGRFTT